MEIFFATKEENNLRREKDFLKLSPAERLISFIEMVCTPSPFPLPHNYVHPNDKKCNFIIRKQDGEKF